MLERRAIDLHEEGLISEAEISGHLQKMLQELGPHPIALALPQHRAICQLTELAPVTPEEVRRAIEAETVKLSGLTDTAMAYDYTALKPFGTYKNPFWLTLCRASELRTTIEQLKLDGAELCEVTASANGLIAAYRLRLPTCRFAVLIDFGAKHTDLVIVADRQGVFASSFPFGSEAFTQTIAADKGCSLDIADLFKRTHDVFAGTETVEGAKPVARNWLQEVEGAVRDWIAEHPQLGATLPDFEVLLTGAGSRQPGFLTFLNEHSELRFALWPDDSGPQPAGDGGHFAVAHGTMLHAFGLASQATSLLPSEFRTAARRRRSLLTLQAVGLASLLLTTLVLAAGTWQKFSLIGRKNELLVQAESAVETAKRTEILNRRIVTEYQRLQPVLELERYALDTIEALNAMQQVRTNRSLWFVLFADQPTYFTASSRPQTNSPPADQTNFEATNVPPARRGFVAELCIPEESDAARRTLSQVVTELKQHRVFRNVDTLSADARRPLAEPKLLLPDKCFSLSLELAESAFPQTPPSVEKTGPAGSRDVKTAPRSFKQKTNSPSGGLQER